MREKVSIIIPVYQTEKYLVACMESVLQQDYPAIEVILVDDGSTDHCPVLCDEYANNNTCISVLHQEHQGAGMARNAGMDMATGKYICFVDSDDCLDGPHAITTLMQDAEAENADIIVGNYRKLTEDGISGPYYHHLKPGEYVTTVDFRFKGFFQYGHLGLAWGKCYKKDFLNKYKLRFSSVSFTEDRAMNLCCCACMPNYAFVEESVYLYRVNKESVTYHYQSDLANMWMDTAKYYQNFLKGAQRTDTYLDLLNFHSCLGIYTIVQHELQIGNKRLGSITRKLKQYGQNALVKDCMKELAGGKYIREIDSWLWKLLVWGVSVLFRMQWYALIVIGLRFIGSIRMDEKLVACKCKKEENR